VNSEPSRSQARDERLVPARWSLREAGAGLLGRAGVAAIVLAGAGLALRPVSGPAWQAVQQGQPILDLRDAEGALGQGVTIALLGGFRGIVADVVWLRANLDWERRDLPATQTLVGLAASLDPRPLYFWINGARIIAYDMPGWRIEAAGGLGNVPAAVQGRIDREQAEAALALLAKGLRFHPDHPLLLIEAGNIRQRRMGDFAGGAELYRRAALQPGAPLYAARIYGEMLRQMGREQEAHAWLCAVHRTLPGVAEAAPELVLERIRQLEERLGMPEGERYRAGPLRE
jgi:hypothetical protein